MRVPLEIAILLAAGSISLIWYAVRFERSAVQRGAAAVSAIGAMLMAVTGRFPTLPEQTGFSPLVTAGSWVLIAGLGISVIATIASIIRKVVGRLRAGG